MVWLYPRWKGICCNIQFIHKPTKTIQILLCLQLQCK